VCGQITFRLIAVADVRGNQISELCCAHGSWTYTFCVTRFCFVKNYIVHSLRVFENRVLRRISGPKREEVEGGWWRRLHNEELYNVQASPNVIRVFKSRTTRWAGHIACMGEMRNTYKIVVGTTEVIRSLRRPCRRWEDNVRMDLSKVGWEGLDWLIWLRIRTSGVALWKR
jgi:hypothetical protein